MSTIPVSTFINHLVPDPDYGYLLSNALTMAAFQVNDYQLRKIRPNLTEGQHYVKLSNPGDNTPRIFYGFNGLLLLCDLLGGDRAQAFKQELLRLTQPQESNPQQPQVAAAIVPAQRSYMVAPQRQPEPQFDAAPIGEMVHAQSGYLSARQGFQQHQSARQVLREELSQVFSQSRNDSTVGIDQLIEQQRLDLEKFKTYHGSFMDAQKQSFEQAGHLASMRSPNHPTQVMVNFSQRLQHDTLAFSLFLAGLFCMFSIASFLVVTHLTQPETEPRPVGQIVKEQ
jgi:hypothetical protein